jgi:GNAT superfamily N-acetyltransferase
MQISKGICFSQNQLIELYNDAEWYSYSNNPDQLWKAFENSCDVYSIFENEELVGIARLIGDGITTIILQDLIIKKNYQNKGFGSKLIELIKAALPASV